MSGGFWERLTAGERRFAVNMGILIGVVLVDVIIGAAFPKLEVFVMTFIGLLTCVAWATNWSAETDWYKRLTS